jgi:cell division septation protein DedD
MGVLPLSVQQQRHPATGAAGATASPLASRGCPTPTGVARAVSPGDVSITTADQSAGVTGGPTSSQHTVFYDGGSMLSSSDTGGRAARSPNQGGSTSTGTVRTHAAGDIAGAGSSPKTSGAAAHALPRRVRAWTVQVASYETFDEALAMQANLCARGYDARIRGSVRPYSVRVGRFTSSDSALALARRLTTRNLTVFVTPAE